MASGIAYELKCLLAFIYNLHVDNLRKVQSPGTITTCYWLKNYHKLNTLNNTHLSSHSVLGPPCGQGYLGPIFSSHQGETQDVGEPLNFSEVRCPYPSLPVVGKVLYPAVWACVFCHEAPATPQKSLPYCQ